MIFAQGYRVYSLSRVWWSNPWNPMSTFTWERISLPRCYETHHDCRTGSAHSSGVGLAASSFSRIFSGVSTPTAPAASISADRAHHPHFKPTKSWWLESTTHSCLILQNLNSLTRMSWVSMTNGLHALSLSRTLRTCSRNSSLRDRSSRDSGRELRKLNAVQKMTILLSLSLKTDC